MKTAAEPMNARLSGSTGRAAPLHELARYVRRHPGLYLLLIPGVVYLLVFEYVPHVRPDHRVQGFQLRQGHLGQ